MKKKLSFLMLALLALTAVAATLARRAVSELSVVSEATVWNFADVTLGASYTSDFKLEGDAKNVENIYANFEDVTYASTFKADALAFTGEYPIRSNSKKFAQSGTLHFKTSVAGKIVVKFNDTGSSASATAVKRYLVVNGTQTEYWTSRENNGTEDPYAAQLNVTTGEIEVPAGDVTIAGSSAICVSYIKFTPNSTEPESNANQSYTLTFKDAGTDSDSPSDLSSEGSIDVSSILGADEAAYVSSVTNATKVYLGRTGRGLKLGTSSVTGTFTLNLATPVKPTSIVVKARKYNNNQNTIKINGNDFTLNDETSDDCTVQYDGNTEVSSIAIEAGNLRAYVLSVTVNYQEAGGEEPQPVADIIYDFAAAATAGENPDNWNYGSAFYGWENEGKTYSKRQDYKGYSNYSGTNLPAECHVFRRSDRINGNIAEGGLKCPNQREMAINGLTAGSKVVIEYTGEGQMLYATGYDPANATAEPNTVAIVGDGNKAAISGTTAIPSGTPIHIVSTDNGYFVFRVLKNMVITKITISEETPIDPATVVKPNKVTVATGIENGTVKVSQAQAFAGDEVTVTATPAEGYELDAISVRGVTSDELVGVNDGKFTMPADAVTVSATFKPAPVDVEIAAADITEGNITAAIVAKAAGKPIKNLTVTLAASTAYTVSAPIEAGANVVIAGPAELAEGETAPVIDASGLKETKVVDEVETTNYLPFIQMSTTPAVAANGKGSFMVDITIKDVTVNDVKSRFFYDNKKKYVAEHFSIDNCVIKLATAATVDGAIEFNQGGVMNFTMTNSTVYQTGEANVNYFTRYNNSIVPDNAIEGYETCNFWTYKNNTFHKISGNQWHNGGRIAQKASTMVVDIENNIWVDCCNDILRRMFGGNKKFSDFKEGSVLANNIFNKDGAVADQGSYGNGSDINGVVAFTDAANGDFNGNCKLAIGAAAPEGKVGDPRWNVTYKESGVVLWSSEEPATIGWGEANITVAAEKFANAKVGDVMHVALQDIPAEAANPWDAQVELRGQNWKALEGAAFVAAPAKTAADFVLTGDILAIAKAQGIQINGTNCKTNLITLEYADKVAGSDASIWVGTATKENVILNKAHFANSNLFGGVKVGDKIRLTVKKTDPEGGEWIGLNYQTPSWVWSDFAEGSFATTITQTEEGAIIDFEVKTAEVAQILNADNAQIIVNNPNQTVTQVELIVAPVDIEISPADGDIAAALKAETDKVAKVGNITINLTKDVTYTVGATLVAPNSITINGNGAIIDASALEANMIQWTNIDAAATWTKADVSISGVTVKGLKKALFFSNSKYYYGDFSLINSVVEQAGDATTFDYTKGSVAINFMVSGSTIYAPTATTKSLYSSQGGQKATEYKDDATQSFAFLLNTMYNLAKGKNFFSHRQSNQKWLAYGVQSNIFVNCGKSGQVIKGMNGGQSGANPTWAISGNAFNFEGADTSADESTGDDEEPVKESVAGVMTFANVETPDFGGTFEMPAGATAPTALGDPRWTITYTNVLDKLYIMGNGTTGGWDATTEMTFNEQTQAFEYTLEVPAGGAWFTFGDAAFDGNWDDFNANHRYAIGEGDVDATIGEALPLVKVNGTLAIKTAGTYNISVAKNLSTVTITSTGTGINSIAADKMKNATIYTVSGQRVEKAQKGLYIIDGKKVVVK